MHLLVPAQRERDVFAAACTAHTASAATWLAAAASAHAASVAIVSYRVLIADGLENWQPP
jgi:hypothetical protein